MKRVFGSIFAAAVASLLAIGAFAQSHPAAGEWELTYNTPGGARTVTAIFKVEGEKLTGTIKRQAGDAAAEGTAKGKEIHFSYVVRYNDNDLRITMSGTLEGDSMKGVVDFGGAGQDEWSAKRAGAAAPRAAASAGIDVTGNWNGEVQTDAGSGTPSFTIKQTGDKLTGRYKGQLGEYDLTGSVAGEKIEFSFKVTGQIEGIVKYSGTTDGKTMKGKVELAGLGEGTFTAKKQ
ncbi:MAG: hypothetical protein ACKVX9_04435 [Blastocatellia bacterium]